MSRADQKAGRGRDSFTLIELLVVIAIIGIILFVTLPGIPDIGRGSNMRVAVTELKTTFSLARQWAITHRQKVFVVFPSRTLNYGSMNEQIYKANRAYSVFAVTNKVNGRGYYVNEWAFLPPGVVFDDDSSLESNVFDGSCVTNVPFPSDNTNVISVHCLVFDPDGSTGRLTPYRVYLKEGWAVVNGASSPWSVNFGIRPNGMKRSVEISGMTGGLRVHEE